MIGEVEDMSKRNRGKGDTLIGNRLLYIFENIIGYIQMIEDYIYYEQEHFDWMYKEK